MNPSNWNKEFDGTTPDEPNNTKSVLTQPMNPSRWDKDWQGYGPSDVTLGGQQVVIGGGNVKW